VHLVRHDELTSTLRQSFGTIADDYDRFRPQPPDDAVDSLIPPGARDALEIGAGTGALTRKLISRVAHVRAVEPDARMRAVLASRVPEAEIVAGQAEEIPADDASFDVVMAASAWHWVDETLALPEVARVLRPGGWLSLLWSGPDRNIEWMRTLWAGGTPLSPEQSAALDARRRDRHVVNLGPDSPFGQPERWLTNWTQPMTKGELVGLAGTYSAVITMGEEDRQDYLDAMTRFLDTHEELGSMDVIDVPMRCLCWRVTLA
jgi:SAM-dependent methyltransferase